MDFEIKINDKLSLKLRKETDAEEVFQLTDANRERLKKWLPWVESTHSPEDTKEFIFKCRKEFDEKKAVDLGVMYEGAWAGSVGFHTISSRNENGEIGYWLASEYVGKGIMTQCVEAMIKYGFEELNLHRIQIRCAAINEKSRAIPERLGFKLEGTIRQDHKIDGQFSDGLVFGLLKEEWINGKKSNE